MFPFIKYHFSVPISSDAQILEATTDAVGSLSATVVSESPAVVTTRFNKMGVKISHLGNGQICAAHWAPTWAWVIWGVILAFIILCSGVLAVGSSGASLLAEIPFLIVFSTIVIGIQWLVFTQFLGPRLEKAINQQLEKKGKTLNMTETYKNCSSCNAQILSTAGFCGSCGTAVSNTPPPKALEETKSCANCNTSLASNAKFCGNCGTTQ